MELLYALESIRTPFLDKLMGLVTNLGGEAVFIVAAIVVFWCLSKSCGYYMMTVGFAGTIINQFLKLWFRIPRPWVKDPNFTIVESARAEATGYSFPSGHTQNAFAVFGAPARFFKNTALRIVFILLIALTAFSRMYVGVHTPLDVGVSLIVGTILVFVIYPFFRDMDKSPKKVYIIFSIFIVLAAAFVAFVELYDFPADIDAENYASGLKNAYMILFCAIGLMLTFFIDTKYVHFPTQALWWAQIIKVVVGLAILLALKSVLKAPLLALFGGHSIAHGVRYFIVILFAGIVWPMTFKFFAKLGKK
ncbi:MAG: phosphatase PAP2 family protein [Oscillospiraceae bacterium]|jgi:membrane-associated phospholipid phosphatase|nr:phosphatase PAP2 family protein [Oscillospiraceae bacterium]